MEDKELWTIEKGFWLQGQVHFASYLHPECVFALPEPSGVIEGKGFVEYLPESGAFSNVVMSEQLLIRPSGNVCILVYKAEGTLRDGGGRSALCTSTFLVEGDSALLIQHQQTPL